MVDPQWNILYWGSKWNLHTVCWDAVGCEWGTTSLDFLSLLQNPSTNIEIIYFCQKYHLKETYKIFKNIHVGLKFEWGLYDQYWLICEHLPFEVFFSCLCDGLLGVTYANMLVTTQWPLKRAAHLSSLCLGLCGMAAWMLNEAICPMKWELRWWGLRVGGGLLGVPVVSCWLLGTPVVGLFGGAVVGSSLGSLRICDSRGTLAASVDVVVVSVGTTWARSTGRAMWTLREWLRTVAAVQSGAAPIPRPVGDPVELLMGQGSDQGVLHLGRGSFVFGNVLYTHFPCAEPLEHASLALQFLSRGNRCLLSFIVSSLHRFRVDGGHFFYRGHPWRGAPPWIGVSPVLGGGWGWNIPLCAMGATSGRESLSVPSSNLGVARQGKRYGPGWPCHCTFQPVLQ